MPFVKVLKNKAYFKRYQVKYRRRREGKTDYYARRKMVVQAKNKYNSPRYRLVVRFSSQYVLAQVTYSEVDQDRVLTQATSRELPRYGLTVGLKNYAASYCTGLLAARRLLNKLNLAELYNGQTEIDGNIVTNEETGRKHFVAEVDEERRPFRCVLDVGIRRTTVGARLFGVLKGASDGGLDIPHNEKNFPGYDREEGEYAPEFHRDRIFGAHVADYMRQLQEADAENGTNDYQKHFSKFIAAGVDADGLEALYGKVHAAIRADPTPKHAENAKTRNAQKEHSKQFRNPRKRSKAQFRNRVAQKKAAFAARQAEE